MPPAPLERTTDVALRATTESRRKGALAAAVAKREKREREAWGFREALRKQVEQKLESMNASLRDAWLAGDWRAAQALMQQAYGLPQQRAEADRDVTIVVRSVLADPPIDVDDEEIGRSLGRPAGEQPPGLGGGFAYRGGPRVRC